jgi:hypothetical protein
MKLDTTMETQRGHLAGRTRKLLGEGFKPPWPPFIQMCEEVWRQIDALLGGNGLRLPS